jgi:hypothetical protein
MKHTLKAIRVSSYVKNGNPVFVYKLVGNKAAIDAYVESKGEYCRFEEGGESPASEKDAPLFFTTRFAGETCTLVPRQSDGEWFVDNSQQTAMLSAVDSLRDGAVKNAMAGRVADALFAQMFGKQASTNTAPSQIPTETPAVQAEGEDGLGDA